MPLSDIVNVHVSINQSTVAQQGFGVPLILAYHTHYADPVRTYAAGDWSQALLADGFTTDEAAYQCAAAAMRQNPRPTTFKIGRRTAAETQRVTITVAGTGPHSVTVTSPLGVSTTVTGADAAAIAAGLGGIAGLTVAGGAPTVTVTAAPGRVWSFHSLSSGLTLRDTTDAPVTADTGVAADLRAIRDYDNDWYGLMMATSSPAAIRQAAEFVEVERKIMVASTHDQGLLLAPTTDVLSEINGLNLARTHLAYHSRAGQFYGPAWMAALMPYEPGQADWKFKTLRGVTADKLTASQRANLVAKGGSFYENPIRGLDITGAATGGDGVFLDLTQLSDWTVARIQEGMVAMLAASPKVAFTDEDGGAKITATLRNVLQQGIALGAIDGDPSTYSVVVPRRAELSPGARAARRWEGVTLTYRPTGAVHSVDTINVYLDVA